MSRNYARRLNFLSLFKNGIDYIKGVGCARRHFDAKMFQIQCFLYHKVIKTKNVLLVRVTVRLRKFIKLVKQKEKELKFKYCHKTREIKLSSGDSLNLLQYYTSQLELSS